MTDWSGCPEVERVKERVSGAWVLTGTRIPLTAPFENLACGATIREFVEWFPGGNEQQVRRVLDFESVALSEDLTR